MGDQIRGFGYTHDDSVDTAFRFHKVLGFLPRPAGTVAGNVEFVSARFDLMLARAELGECDLVARSKADNGYLYLADGTFKTNKAGKKPLADKKLRAKAVNGVAVTYTCAPPGSGLRMALDGDEIDAGSNPAGSNSVPVNR